MVSDKTIYKAFRIQKTINKLYNSLKKFFIFIIYQNYAWL